MKWLLKSCTCAFIRNMNSDEWAHSYTIPCPFSLYFLRMYVVCLLCRVVNRWRNPPPIGKRLKNHRALLKMTSNRYCYILIIWIHTHAWFMRYFFVKLYLWLSILPILIRTHASSFFLCCQHLVVGCEKRLFGEKRVLRALRRSCVWERERPADDDARQEMIESF